MMTEKEKIEHTQFIKRHVLPIMRGMRGGLDDAIKALETNRDIDIYAVVNDLRKKIQKICCRI